MEAIGPLSRRRSKLVAGGKIHLRHREGRWRRGLEGAVGVIATPHCAERRDHTFDQPWASAMVPDGQEGWGQHTI